MAFSLLSKNLLAKKNVILGFILRIFLAGKLRV